MDINNQQSNAQLYNYPFDRQRVETVFLVIDRSTNNSLPILGVEAVDPADNYYPVQSDDFAVKVGRPSGAGGDQTDMLDARVGCFYLWRPTSVRGFVLLLFIINWLLTASVIFITALVVSGRQITEGVVVLPVGVILTLPGVRALWPGAPGFGQSTLSSSILYYRNADKETVVPGLRLGRS